MNSENLVRTARKFAPIFLIIAFMTACTQEAPVRVGESQSPEKVAKPKAKQATRLTVPRGTQIRLAMNTSVSSSSSQAGDTFTARTTHPVVVGSRVAIPAGSIVHGQVSKVVPAKKGLKKKEGSLSLSFDKVVTPAGFSAPMSAGIASVAPKSTKQTAGIIGGSAAGGAVLGKVFGGSTKDAAVGAVVGGAIGTGIAAGTKGKDVDIPGGSALTIALSEPMLIAVKL